MERELYDHEEDPEETVNVIGENRYGADIERLSGLARIRKTATDHDHEFKQLR